MNDLQTAAQQALEACEQRLPLVGQATIIDELNALRAALAQEQVEPAQKQEPYAWMAIGGTIWRHKTSEDDVPLYTAPPKAEPAQAPGAWAASTDGRVIYDDISADDGLLRVSGDFENDEQRIKYAQFIVDKLNAAPPQRPAEPVQEPVAKVELMTTGGNAGLATRIVEIDNHLRERLRPGQLLYTAPPRRTMVPLTEEEIDAEWHELDGEASALFKRVLRKFSRAVEKASWEKNHGQA